MAKQQNGIDEQDQGSTTPDHPVMIGVVASAGGLAALKALCGELDQLVGASVMITQHVSPTHHSQLPELLAACTECKVETAKTGVRPAAGTIYVVPPDRDAVFQSGVIRLRKPDPDTSAHPSGDRLLVSIAASCDERCVAVILSGTGQDGSTGAKAVKAAGGVVLVQDPDTAQYDGMPRAAIRTGCADSVSTPAEIGRRLDTIGRSAGGLLLHELPNRDLDDDYTRVCRIVRRKTGLRLDNYKRGTVLRRIRRRIGMSSAASLDEYCDLLDNDEGEARQLASDVLIPVTAFFRDTGAFKAMAKAVKEVMTDRPSTDMVRCWVAGCATGEEAYSLAILLAEARRGQPDAPDFMIFVSDLKREVVDVARRGIYPAAALEPIPKELRDRYFEHVSDEYHASKLLRRRMVFATQNLIDDPPFSRMDMITCRNVMIYFSPESQRRVLGIFHYALNKDGILFLGKSETPDKYGELYSAIDARARIYRRVEGARAEDTQLRSAFDPTPRTPATKRQRVDSQAEALTHAVHSAAVKLFAPPSVVIDDANRPVHVIGDVSPFVGLPSGPTQWSVFDLLAAPILAEVRAMVFRCRSEGSSVEGGTYTIEKDNQMIAFSPSVHQTTINDVRYVIIAFHIREDEAYGAGRGDDDTGNAIANELERELATTRLHLQTVLEEVESANEELQSLNEELQSSNEELQSTNEELQTSNEEMQSTNEELMTVNDELAVKSDELAGTARDLEIIKETLNFPLIVLDENQRIRRYNSAASTVLELGSIKESANIRSAGWTVQFKQLGAGLAKLTGDEDEASVTLESDDGRTWRVHSSRYKDSEKTFGGHVITFMEISEERRTARALADREAYYRVAFEHSAVAMIITEANGTIRSANAALTALVGRDMDSLIGQPLNTLFTSRQKKGIEGALKSLRGNDSDAARLEAELVTADQSRWVSITMAATTELEDTAPYVIAQVVDIHTAKHRERKLSEEFTRLRLISELSRLVATDTAPADVIQQAVASLSVVFDDCRVAYAAVTPHYAAVTARARPEGTEPTQVTTIHGNERDKFARQAMVRARTPAAWEATPLPWELLIPQQTLATTLDVPVVVHEELLGVLSLQSEASREWTQFEYSTLSGVADLLSLAYRNEQDDKHRASLVQALSDEKERVEVTLRSIGDGVITTDLEGRVEYMNPTAEDLIGTALTKAQGKSLFNVYRVVRSTDQRPLPNPIELCLRTKSLVEDADPDATLLSESGLRIPIDHSAAPIQDSQGEMTGAVLVFRDVSDERMLARELSYKATHDALTGLVNRTEFERRLHQLILGAGRHEEQHVMCFVDLDRFKVINDTCGHAAGDELLKQLSELLGQKLRRSDMLARLGGDEFGILLEHCTVERAEHIASEAITALNELDFKWHGRSFQVGASIGIVTIDQSSASIPTVMSQADAACYAAKQRGRNQVCVYSGEDMSHGQRHDETDLLPQITNALEQDTFVFYFEPVILSEQRSSDEPFYLELTLRMPVDDGAPPMVASEFLPAAERYFLMTAIDRWVVHHALRQLAALNSESIRMGINLSGQSLGDATFTAYVLDEIEQAGINPAQLLFEITESAAVSYIAEAVHFIKSLRKLGCRFALDDFGTGMSSFAYLRDLPVDLLKVDKRFVQASPDSPVDRALIEAQVNIAKELGIETIAEGVETQEQSSTLRELGVVYQQGFLHADPKPLKDL